MISILANIQPPFIPGSDQLGPFAPELWLIAAIVATLITPFFTTRENANRTAASVALGGIAIAFVSVFFTLDANGLFFRGLLVVDSMAIFWKGLLLLFTGGIVVMWFGTSGSRMHAGDGPEFFTLLLGATLGMSLMAQTTNLLMLFLVVEMASLPSYVMAGFRKTHRLAAEASLKYVLFGAATSAIMVYGLSLAYGMFGSLQIELIARQMAAAPAHILTAVVLMGLIVGLAFKISAVPFHFWCPDVFEGASVDVSAFLSVASKGAAIALLLRIVMTIGQAFAFQDSAVTTTLAWVIGLLGAITATWGNTAAFVQTNLKRLLAYSSIAHAGYMLCALSLVVGHGLPNPGEDAIQAVMIYLAVYLFMNLGAFTVAGVVARETGSEELAAFSGLGRRAPWLAAAMAACLISLVGLPPLAGFAAKLMVMLALFRNGGWWIALVVVIGVNTVISLYYYARILRVMYLEDRGEPRLAGPITARAVAITCAAMLVLMLLGFNALSRMTEGSGDLHQMAPAAQTRGTDARLVQSPL
jgi:NADH-quinone oxidoreductase subunit N